MKRNKNILSTRKIKLYQANSKIIKFFRRNPVIACEDLLGIKLLDFQKWIIQEAWNKPMVLMACSRNAGKSFLGAIIIILKAVLYENQSIYIVAPVGDQSKELFNKIEEIVLNIGKTASSIDSLKDIVMNEVVKSPSCKTGFSHPQSGFHVEFYNGSEIYSLNGNPDNNRSKRATLVFFDECGFMSEEAIAATEAFATQDSNFKTSIKKDFNIKAQRKKCPTQLIYASSASDVDTTFFKHYKNFAKQMFLGNPDFFCCDIPCEVPLKPTMDGELYPPLLTQAKIDSAMKANRDKAMREYYNKFTKDGGESQIVKWGAIRRNETLLLPELHYTNGGKYVLAFDPARINDCSIIGVMKIIEDPNIGYYGEIVNITNLIDIASKKGYKMTSQEQIKSLKDSILSYNGDAPDYENIEALLIDPGAGGGGINVFGDALLEDWVDDKGITHRGLIDKDYDIYKGFEDRYPNAITDKLRFLSPTKYRTQMVDEFIELMGLDLIKFTKEYSGNGYITLEKEKSGKADEKEIELIKKHLSLEEEISLINIDIAKTEITSIHKFENAEKTKYSYALSKEKERTMNDDRFYVIIMLAHYLYGLRRSNITRKKTKPINMSGYLSLWN